MRKSWFLAILVFSMLSALGFWVVYRTPSIGLVDSSESRLGEGADALKTNPRAAQQAGPGAELLDNSGEALIGKKSAPDSEKSPDEFMELEERLQSIEINGDQNVGLIAAFADLLNPDDIRDAMCMQKNGYPPDLDVRRWNETVLRAQERSGKPGAIEALELLDIYRGANQPNGGLLGSVSGGSFGSMVAAGYYLGLIGPGFADGEAQTVRDLSRGFAHNFAAQRLGDRSLLPAVAVAHPDYRFSVFDYIGAPISQSTALVARANRSRERRPLGLPVKDGWRELD